MSAASPLAPAPPGPLPDSAYRQLALLLRVGLVVALALLGVGLIALLARAWSSDAAGWIASNPLVRDLDLRNLGAGLADGSATAYMTLGVLVLIATPVLRVLGGMLAFVAHRERRLAVITATVLALLLLGLLVIGPSVR